MRDPGNGGCTLITMPMARRLGIVDSAGRPVGVSRPRYILVRFVSAPMAPSAHPLNRPFSVFTWHVLAYRGGRDALFLGNMAVLAHKGQRQCSSPVAGAWRGSGRIRENTSPPSQIQDQGCAVQLQSVSCKAVPPFGSDLRLLNMVACQLQPHRVCEHSRRQRDSVRRGRLGGPDGLRPAPVPPRDRGVRGESAGLLHAFVLVSLDFLLPLRSSTLPGRLNRCRLRHQIMTGRSLRPNIVLCCCAGRRLPLHSAVLDKDYASARRLKL